MSDIYRKQTTMSEEGKQVLRSAQNARIIVCISEMFNVPLDKATDIYYNSETANLIEEGIADLHCRSDKYLAGEIWREYQERKNNWNLLFLYSFSFNEIDSSISPSSLNVAAASAIAFWELMRTNCSLHFSLFHFSLFTFLTNIIASKTIAA